MIGEGTVHKWRDARVAVLGGDVRELEVIRNYLDAGCAVRTYGVVSNDSFDHTVAKSATEAVSGADIIIAPVPGVGLDDTLYAPHAPEPISVTEELFAAASSRPFYFSGYASEGIRAVGKKFGVRFCDLRDDDYLQVLHAIPTAEGAISTTVRETEFTIHGTDALVVGYGRIAVLLARNLVGLGARVTVAARRPEVRVRAYANGHNVCETTPEALSQYISGSDLVYATAPASLLTREVLCYARSEALIMDLASPPGGLDHESGRELGLKVVWARGQAGTAPRHSGHAQYLSMARTLDAEYI